MASKRPATSSASRNVLPYPVEPRTFGANTVTPRATSAWYSGENVGRSCASGPPCRCRTAGPGGSVLTGPSRLARSGPAGPAGPAGRGRYSQPVSSVPSSAVSRSSVGMTKASAPGTARSPGRARRQGRCAAGLRTSTTQTARGWAVPCAQMSRRRPSRVKMQLSTTSAGTGAGSFTRDVAVSRSSSRLRPATFHTNAAVLPSSLRTKLSRSSPSR